MLITPSEHYSRFETLIDSQRGLKQYIDDVTSAANARKCDVYWRGQSQATWPISSSLARIATSMTALQDADLNHAERSLLKEAKGWIKPAVPLKNDLEWLAYLQHHSIPTRMIDFSTSPHVATFFASDNHDDDEGRIFANLVPREKYFVDAENPESVEIGKIPSGEMRLWRPAPTVSPRLAAQFGVFFLGRLPSTNVRRYVNDAGLLPAAKGYRLMSRAEVVQVMSLPFDFMGIPSGPPTMAYKIRTLTARIHIDKASLREALARRSPAAAMRPPGGLKIDHSYCFPDVEGMLKFSTEYERVRRGL